MEKTYSAIMGNEGWSLEDDTKFEYAEAAKENGFSLYGLQSVREFFAEAIVQYL